MRRRDGPSIEPVVFSPYWKCFGQFCLCTLSLDRATCTCSSAVHPCTTKCPAVSTSSVGILFQVSAIIIIQTTLRLYFFFFWMRFRHFFQFQNSNRKNWTTPYGFLAGSAGNWVFAPFRGCAYIHSHQNISDISETLQFTSFKFLHRLVVGTPSST